MKHSSKKSFMSLLILVALFINALGVMVTPAYAASNLALNQPVLCSSEQDTTLGCSNAVDGDGDATRWSSEMGVDPQWIQVDLGATYDVNEVVLNWQGGAYGLSYEIQMSDDASTWTPIYSTTAGDGGFDDITGLTGTGRYIRMYGTARAGGWGYSLWEFEVYDTPSAPAVSLDYASWDFGDVQVGNDGWQGFTLTNTGTADLVIGTLEINGSDFSFNKNYCSDATLLPSDECYFEVYFTPDSAGAKSGSVSIPSNASTSPDGVDLSGNGVVNSPSAPVVDAPEIVTNDATPVISGTADANSWINAWYFDDFDNPVLICEDVLVDEFGGWSCVSSEVLPEREIALVVNATDDVGNTSDDTYHYFIVDLTAPSVPVVDFPAVIVASATPDIGGTADAHSWINVWYFDDFDNSVLICENILVDEFGDWSCVSSEVLPEREIALAVNATDDAGNTSDDISYYFIVDLTAPTVDSIVLADPDPTVAASVNFTVTFSKPVKVADVGTDDFTLDNAVGEIIDPWVDSVTPDSACEGNACDVYTVTVGTGTGAGTLRLDVPVDATISDLAGNSLDGLPFTDGEAYTIDKGLGKFDDGHGGWTYDGFTATTTTGPYLGTMHYSKVVGSEAAFPIDGSQITLWYSKYSNRGTLEVYVDDGPTPIATINQYNATRIWQASWTSGDLGRGEHVVRLVHAGGGQVDVDALEVKEYVIPGPDKYDDAHEGWTYTGFTATTTTGPYLGTMHYSKVVGSEAEFTFEGSQITLWYSKYSNRGKVEVYLDDNPDPIATIDQYNATRIWQASWTSGNLRAGEHTVRLVHAGGAQVDVDAIEVKEYVVPGLGKHDDRHEGWTYDGFTATTTTGPYLGTMHYSKVVGSEAAFTFEGSQITLWYSKYSNRGTLEVYLDDNPDPIATINQYNATRIWQASWTSEKLGAGEHIVRLVHAGGAQVDVDALEVKEYAVPGPDKYDNVHEGWTYTGFTASTTTGPYLGTMHYSKVVGSEAEFTFEGSQITLWYSKYSNRGKVEVYIDDNPDPVDTIDQYNATRIWQASWTSEDLGAGEHTVRFVHVDSGQVDIDAIEVLP